MRIAVLFAVGSLIATTPTRGHAAPTDGAQIIDGAATIDHPVVGLAGPGGNVNCTGTVIAPRVVLTAAHCVIPTPPSLIYFGARPAEDGVYVPIAEIVVHPDATLEPLVNDLALVRLGRASPVPPARLPEAPLDASAVGRPMRLVGFGLADRADELGNGNKLTGATTLARLDPLWLEYGVVACFGDSGGPAFLADDRGEVLVGVTSHGDPDCAVNGVSARVDVARAWIDDQVARLDQPGCDLDARCVATCSADPDCISPTVDDPEPAPSTAGCVVGAGARGAHGAGVVALLALALLRRRRGSATRRVRPHLAVLAGAAVTLAGCTTDDDPLADARTFCRSRPIGDLAAPIEAELVLHDRGVLRPLGARLATTRALALSVRVRNLDGCAVAVRVVEADGQAIGGTFVELQPRGGWGWPTTSAFNAIAVPARAERRDLWAIVEDQDGRSGVSRALAITQ